MILKGVNHQNIYDSPQVQKIIDKKHNCYFKIKVLDKENGSIGVYDDDKIIDNIFFDVEQCKLLFERLDYFMVEIIPEGYYVIRYCDIHAHSAYSILDGMSTIEGLADAIEHTGALTDHGNMFGFYKFYKAMVKRGKKPIIGFEAYVNRFSSIGNGNEGEPDGKERAHVVLLVKNKIGFKNAIKLTTLGYQKGKKTKKTVKPAITYSDLFKHKEGLIVTSACMGGDIPKNIEIGNIEKAKEIAIKLKEEFGDDFYIEIQRHEIKEEVNVNFHLINIARELGIKIIAGVDSHYIKPSDKHSQEVLLANNRKTTMSNPNRWVFPGDRYYKIPSHEMEELYADIPEALDNTLEISRKIEFELEDKDYHLPEFNIPKGFNSEYDYLVHLCRNGMKDLNLDSVKKYEKRLEDELEVIKKMGYSSYFLIVWDFVSFAKNRGILVGPGRGSACGSLVSYTLRITDVDPIRYGLLFERFLSPDRVTMPDIDIDFQDDRREEVIEYVREKYGDDCVSYIITYSNMKSKSAVRDVARIYDFEPSFGDLIAKMIPDGAENLEKALTDSEEFRNIYNTKEDVKKVVDTAITIEGLPKATSKHACFTKDTLITTKQGKKNIIDISIGDLVLTHKNRFRRVVDLIKTHTDTIYTVKIEGLKPIKVTGNHPFYVRERVDIINEPIWKEVSLLESSKDYVAIADNKSDIGKLGFNDFKDENFTWRQISSIKKNKISSPMYNLTVEDDSSYIANGVVVHNCGVIIAPDAITEYIPQVVVLDETGEKDSKGSKLFEPVMVTQLDMTECEELGLLKMDFLGLRNLSVISGALKLINEKRERQSLPLLTMDDIPITDPYAYKHIQAGNTVGVFQLESDGMTNLVSETYTDIDKFVNSYEKNKLTNEKGIGVFGEEFDALFERLIALISLYRPGPMDEIPNYLHNMKNPKNIKYDTPELEPILSNTYGIIVYQEQVMQTVRELAGFSAGQSDDIRRGMGKKKEEVVQEYEEYFIYGSDKADETLKKEGKDSKDIQGCLVNGIRENVAKTIWEKMYKFARYAFNKSHATGYAVVSIRTAWLSYHYPLEFMTALLNSNIGKKEKLEHYVHRIKQLGITLLGPDVNMSKEVFSISYEELAIRFGLRGVKGLGASSVTVMEARGNRKFKSLTDFAKRLSEHSKCDKKVLENIAKCGAFESIEKNRKAIVESAEMIVNSLKKDKSKNVSGQINIFDQFEDDSEISDIGKLTLVSTADYSKSEKLEFEKDLLSFYVSGHPLDEYESIISNIPDLMFLSDIKLELSDDEDEYENDDEDIGLSVRVPEEKSIEDVLILGQITECEDKTTKKGDTMSIMTIEDKTGEMRCVVFPKTRTAYRDRLTKGNIVVISGKAVNDDFGMQIIVQDISSADILSNQNEPNSIILYSPYSRTGYERAKAIELYRLFQEFVQKYSDVNSSTKAIFKIDGKSYELGTLPMDIMVITELKQVFGEDKLIFNQNI